MSFTLKAALQIFAGAFMIIMGLNMSGFGLFRKINIRLPWSACKVKKKPRAPFVIGLLNGFMPCGPLQTMQLYALGTGSAFKGALSMFLFSLGTVPLMLSFGALSGLLSKNNTKTILKFSGILIVVLGIFMGTRGLALAGVNVPNISFGRNGITTNITASAATASSASKAVVENAVQVIRMTADENGYTPNGLYVSKVPTSRLIHKVVLSGSVQTASITGKGYEFEPLVTVVNIGVKTKLSVDLTNFDSPEGEYTIANLSSGETVTTFNGKKGIVNVEFTINSSDTYGIQKDGNLLEIIDAVYNMNDINLEEVRSAYIR